MENPISSTFMLIAGILILTLFPLQHAWRVTERTCYSYVQAETNDFCDNLRHKGYMDETMYQDFLRHLARTQQIYDVRMIHTRKVYFPLSPTDPQYTVDRPYLLIEEQYALTDIFQRMRIDPQGRYWMGKGDGISVEVSNKSRNDPGVFWSLLGGSSDNAMLFVRAAGAVTNVDE